ncbi:MAG: V-type ATP synthase subunit E [Actinobacteria bacterium]|nr:V-type ATP synthase subunit E [Actinomycetota bacterium]MBU1943333.1 V-type ATP synthase subunit E [Actinomycetota bacterium]MBU2686549.1 V-type ATP synthase subunit E [Actinomycetota bacterium]
MPLDKLLERILTDAEQHSLQIVGNAQRERTRLEETAEAEAEHRYDRMVKAAERSAEDERKQRVTIAGLDARKSVLERKQEMIAGVFEAAVAAVREMPPAEYVERMAGQLAASGRRAGDVLLSPRDRGSLGERLVARANELVSGAAGSFTLAPGTRDIAGGFILSSGGIEINYSLEALINSRKEEFEPLVVQALFGEVDR